MTFKTIGVTMRARIISPIKIMQQIFFIIALILFLMFYASISGQLNLSKPCLCNPWPQSRSLKRYRSFNLVDGLVSLLISSTLDFPKQLFTIELFLGLCLRYPDEHR